MKPKSSASRLLRDLSIVVAVTAGLLVACELGLRVAFPGRISVTEPKPDPQPSELQHDIAYLPNSDYIVALKPNLRTTFRMENSNGGHIINWETNSLSFRGNELKAHPDFRVMVYGDSNIQAQFSLNESTFAFRLQRYLSVRFAAADVEVVNSGVVGFGPDQSLIKMSIEADAYRPNLVVLNIFADNDFGDIVRNRLFELDESGNLVHTKFKVGIDQAFVTAGREADSPARASELASSLLLVKAAGKIANLFRHPRSPQ